ncbi:MAG: hypothetical protein HGB03_00190 [Candidatus Yonathbacteria bacterium]|nr:hypothetical protein [Candidatus Yonathbacteria bacterium]NTW48099.1 hypothetical protein [Candidatus Yonathbacteria bacterium]
MTTYHLTSFATIIRRMTGVFSTVFAVFFIVAFGVYRPGILVYAQSSDEVSFSVETFGAFLVSESSALIECHISGAIPDEIHMFVLQKDETSSQEIESVFVERSIYQSPLLYIQANHSYTYQCIGRSDAGEVRGEEKTFMTKGNATVLAITHQGKEIHEGDILYTEDFLFPTDSYGMVMQMQFYWPVWVENGRTLFALVRGVPGHLEGGSPLDDVNYVSSMQVWGEGVNGITKYMGQYGYDNNKVSMLADARTMPSLYTFFIAERPPRDQYVTDDEIMTWFASGGSEGVAPIRHATMTFEYRGTRRHDTPPTLNYIPNDSYATDAHIAGRGVEPNKGVADKDPLTFATLYTDQDGDTPAYVRLWVKDATGTDTFYDMTRETGAHAPAPHTDGNTQNGEWYTFTGTFPKGIYSYAFLTADTHDGNPGEEVSFPAPLSGTPTDNPLSFTTGYSNVAFLPGIGGSRLYADYGVGEMVWEPNDLADVAEIRLDTDTHESANPSIVVSGITDEILLRLDAWPTTNVYKTFMQFMDTQVVGAGIINTWKPLAYDWRLGLDTLVTRGTHIDTRNGNDVISYNITTEGTSTPYLLSELRHLADTSDSGKVSLIAHSNGGLLAKYILKHLVDTHDPLLDRIDTVMLVASPQWGTPEAAATLLHGTTKIGKGMERDTAETLPSAYHLLPSEAYLEHVQTPVFVFDPEVSSISDLVDFAGRAIGGSGAYEAFTDFMTGHAGTWTEPIDVDAPNVLDTELLAYAKDVHEALDTWTPPAHVRVVQIAGWGVDTIRGIAYDNCDIPFCPQTLSTLDRTLQKTTLGDGTVVLPSAIAMSGGVETYFLNLDAYNHSGLLYSTRNRKHAGILEVDILKDFLKNIFTNTDLLPAYISTIEPTSPLASKALHFTMHSPVAVHLYDTEGNHTGIIPNPNSASDIRVYEENIPNSYYEEWGETKYIGASDDGPITLVLDGEGSGTFTLEIEETQGNETTAYTVFTDIPVSTTSAGSLTIASVSDVGALTLDNNGDGTPDVYAFTDEMKEVIDYGILKEAVQALSSNQKKTLLTQITLMEALHKRGAVIAEKALLRVFDKQIETLVNPKLPAKARITMAEKVKIDAIVTVLFEQLEEPVKKRKNDIQENIKKLRERIVNELRK